MWAGFRLGYSSPPAHPIPVLADPMQALRAPHDRVSLRGLTPCWSRCGFPLTALRPARAIPAYYPAPHRWGHHWPCGPASESPAALLSFCPFHCPCGPFASAVFPTRPFAPVCSPYFPRHADTQGAARCVRIHGSLGGSCVWLPHRRRVRLSSLALCFVLSHGISYFLPHHSFMWTCSLTQAWAQWALHDRVTLPAWARPRLLPPPLHRRTPRGPHGLSTAESHLGGPHSLLGLDVSPPSAAPQAVGSILARYPTLVGPSRALWTPTTRSPALLLALPACCRWGSQRVAPSWPGLGGVPQFGGSALGCCSISFETGP